MLRREPRTGSLKVASTRGRSASCQLVSLALNPASRQSELEVDSEPDRRGARTIRRIERGSPGRGERVSPLSIASLLTELPDGTVRLCGGREGPDNRPVVPLVNDVDAPFFHRPASSSAKLACAQGPKFADRSPVTRPLRVQRRKVCGVIGRISSAKRTACGS